MKIFTNILIGLAFGLVIFNATQLDFKNLTEGNSFAALAGVVMSLCAICILLIFRLAKNIEEKTRNH
jgi:tetrahydromethanopterin S-methyltransferase subunit E